MSQDKKSVDQKYCDFKKALHSLIRYANKEETTEIGVSSLYSNFKKLYDEFTEAHTPGNSTSKWFSNKTEVSVYQLYVSTLLPNLSKAIKDEEKEKRIERLISYTKNKYTKEQLAAVQTLNFKLLLNIDSINQKYCDFKKALHSLIRYANKEETTEIGVSSLYSNFKKLYDEFRKVHAPGSDGWDRWWSSNQKEAMVYELYASTLLPNLSKAIKDEDKAKCIEPLINYTKNKYTKEKLVTVQKLDFKSLLEMDRESTDTLGRTTMPKGENISPLGRARSFTLSISNKTGVNLHTMWRTRSISLKRNPYRPFVRKASLAK